MKITGKWEFEVAPGKLAQVRDWVTGMEKQFLQENGEIRTYTGPASESGFVLDDATLGMFDPFSVVIYLFYSEESNIAARAEELAHYFQYKDQKLLGKTENEIGADTINANELAVKDIMLAHGFAIRR